MDGDDDDYDDGDGDDGDENNHGYDEDEGIILSGYTGQGTDGDDD